MNTQSEKSVNKQTIRTIADKHITVERKNMQWKTNTTLGMFRGIPNKTNRHNYYGNLDISNENDSYSSEDSSKTIRSLKKKMSFWEKLKFSQNE